MRYLKSFELFESTIDHSKINLDDEFDHVNAELFDNKVKRVPLRWMNTKNVVGLMNYDEDGNITGVGISKYYEMTLQQFHNVLAHEMIHVYLEQTGVKEKDAHGPIFTNMRNTLNKKFPKYNIVKSENAANFEVSKHAKINELGAILFDEGDDTYSMIVVKANALTPDEIENFIIKWKRIARTKFKNLRVIICKSSHPDLAKFKIKNNLGC